MNNLKYFKEQIKVTEPHTQSQIDDMIARRSDSGTYTEYELDELTNHINAKVGIRLLYGAFETLNNDPPPCNFSVSIESCWEDEIDEMKINFLNMMPGNIPRFKRLAEGL